MKEDKTAGTFSLDGEDFTLLNEAMEEFATHTLRKEDRHQSYIIGSITDLI